MWSEGEKQAEQDRARPRKSEHGVMPLPVTSLHPVIRSANMQLCGPARTGQDQRERHYARLAYASASLSVGAIRYERSDLAAKRQITRIHGIHE